ncbi:root phototropism protein 3-like [Glycine max]|uniref:NPH3 domain-containing protein n=1 Tax=Glycine max TaxID=3847 RepID=C6TE91_SOYBN|nr:root phototropism protein 3-like [Glycine max]ACU20143.1 unknown [Glycine max]|eukprot:NP_001304457.1 root phototropism protein 3-like [Glycine max]
MEMKKPCCEESETIVGSWECWFDDACIVDMDYFVKTLSSIKQKGVRADLIGSIITHYASIWLPDLSSSAENGVTTHFQSPESVTNSWMKKRFFVETLVSVLPPEKDSVPCNFLLRLLRTANMVRVDATYRGELENRISWQLDQASLKELMIPSFSHTCGTLLDVELVLRLVKRFMSLDRDGAALVKVAKLVDCYLAEAAVDANLTLSEFIALAGALPSHSRATDDGLYRAIDTYLKAHPDVSKQERKGLCRLLDSRKLTTEASLHAAQNERLPVRAVIQVLFSEQTKLNRHIDWSGSFSSLRSPNGGLDPPGRCLSKRETNAQQMEIRKLKEDVYRLQSQFNAMQGQMERMAAKKKGLFKWRKFGMPTFSRNVGEVEKIEEEEGEEEAEREVGFGRQTPMDMKTSLVKRTPHKWRKSMS